MWKLKKCKKCGSQPILNINDAGRQNGYSIRWAFVECEKCGETGRVASNIVFDLASDISNGVQKEIDFARLVGMEVIDLAEKYRKI